MRSRHPLPHLARIATISVALTLAATTGLPHAGAAETPNPTQGIPAALPEPAATAPIEDKRAWCRFEVERRTIKLHLLDAEVVGSKRLTAGHRAKLTGLLTSTRDGVGALDAAMAAETDRANLDKACRDLASKHLVFSLRTPQIQNVIGADTVVVLSRSLKAVSDELGPRIDEAEKIGNPNVARMRELNADVVTLTADATQRVDGVSDALLRVTPADWLANREVLKPHQAKNRQSWADLGKARENIAEIRRLLEWTPPKPTVEPGQVAGVWSPAARFKSFANTGAQELYVGFGDLGRQPNRSGMDMTFRQPSTNSFTFAYAPAHRSVRVDVDLLADGHADGNASFATPTMPCVELDRLQILVAAKHKNTTVSLKNVVLNGQPLGDFDGVSDASTYWNLVGVDLSGGFTVTGDIELAGKFAGGDEHSKVEIQAGCAPAAG